MDKEPFEELVLKVKVNTYREVSNYLRNELKLTPATVEAIIQKQVAQAVEKKLAGRPFEEMLNRVIEANLMTLLGLQGHYDKENLRRKIQDQLVASVKSYAADVCRNSINVVVTAKEETDA